MAQARDDLRPQLRRRTLLTAGLSVAVGTTVLSGCGLRLEKDAPLPGPKETAAPDARPLQQVRGVLVTALEQSAAAARTTPPAAAMVAVHRAQLQRLDARITGLGATPGPTPTVSSAPAATSTAAPSPTSHPAATSSTPATASASTPASASSSTPPPGWVAAENAWASPRNLMSLASVSGASRALALSIAARGIAAATETGHKPTWPSETGLPSRGAAAILDALETAIAADEWVAAKTPAKDRGKLPATLHWLYAARASAQAAAATPSGSPSTAPVYTFADRTAASKAATSAMESLVVACAKAAASARTPSEVAGLLLMWSNAVGELLAERRPVDTFPGLTRS